MASCAAGFGFYIRKCVFEIRVGVFFIILFLQNCDGNEVTGKASLPECVCVCEGDYLLMLFCRYSYTCGDILQF